MPDLHTWLFLQAPTSEVRKAFLPLKSLFRGNLRYEQAKKVKGLLISGLTYKEFKSYHSRSHNNNQKQTNKKQTNKYFTGDPSFLSIWIK